MKKLYLFLIGISILFSILLLAETISSRVIPDSSTTSRRTTSSTTSRRTTSSTTSISTTSTIGGTTTIPECTSGENCPACEYPEVAWCDCRLLTCGCEDYTYTGCSPTCGTLGDCNPPDCPQGYENCGVSGDGNNHEGCVRMGSCTGACSGCGNGWIKYRYCRNTISSTTGTTTGSTIPQSLYLLTNVSKFYIRRLDNQVITSTVSVGYTRISGARVDIEIKYNESIRFAGSCITDSNGQCSLTYQIPSDAEFGVWYIFGNATKQGYIPTQTTIPFHVVQCLEDNDCKTYEYCSMDPNFVCTDLRPLAVDCNYFDYCSNGVDPGTNQPCQWEINCYSSNVEQSYMLSLCNDSNWFNHTLLIQCGLGGTGR